MNRGRSHSRPHIRQARLAKSPGLDHYEVLQVSPRAQSDTIQRVFRFLAKRFHPDNPETGNADRFKQLMESFRVLSDPEQRAAYDATYEEHRETRWRIFDQASAGDEVAADRRVRSSILQLFYTARRRDPDHPGLGVYDLERLLGCPEDHIKFHVWYLKENGWVQRLENGMLAITASGVDRALDDAEAPAPGQPRLRAVE
jgi:curved DNA-binding protein CbpA